MRPSSPTASLTAFTQPLLCPVFLVWQQLLSHYLSQKNETPPRVLFPLLNPTAAAAAAATSVVSDSVQPHRRQPPRLPRLWDSPGKNTGVGCHFLLQCMKVKSEREIAQSCLTLRDPMDCSLPGSSVHGISQARVLEQGAISFSTLTPQIKSIMSTSYQALIICS